MEKDQVTRISDFATARWSLVLEAASEGNEEAASEGLAALCEIY